MWLRVAAFVALCALAGATAADDIDRLADGWHTWQVDATDGVQSCCYRWRSGQTSQGACRLDGGSMSVSIGGDCRAGAGAAQVYVRVVGGDVHGIRVLSSSCPVESRDPVADHGIVSAAANLAWFRSVIENRRIDQDVREDALFALVQTESDAAFAYLDRLLADR